MATIRDVAQKAGVGVATVSRVLNDSGYVDHDTRQRVQAAVDELGYRRNVHWSRLAAQSSKTIIFVLGNRDALNSMQMRVLVACEKALDAEGYDLLFTRFTYSGNVKPQELKLPRVLEQPGAVDGVVLAGVHFENITKALDTRKLPFVILGNNFSSSARTSAKNCVLYDDENGVFEATRYLLRLGHQRIAFIGNVQRQWFSRRYKGYERCLGQAGLPTIQVTDDWAVSNFDYGQLGVAQLLRESMPPSAIVAANDEIAAGASKELRKRELHVPRDMSLVGLGDRAEFSILEPSLTTVAVFEDQLGERLGRMLLERLATSQSIPSEKYPCKLVERQSCAPWKAPISLRRPARLEIPR
jgi:DNA-binding LacI/PurR family transcriptional regulator